MYQSRNFMANRTRSLLTVPAATRERHLVDTHGVLKIPAIFAGRANGGGGVDRRPQLVRLGRQLAAAAAVGHVIWAQLRAQLSGQLVQVDGAKQGAVLVV